MSFGLRSEKKNLNFKNWSTEVLKSWTCELSANSSARNLWEPSPSTIASIANFRFNHHFYHAAGLSASTIIGRSPSLSLSLSLSLYIYIYIYIYICSIHRPAKQIAAFIGMRFQKGWLGYLNCCIVTISYF